MKFVSSLCLIVGVWLLTNFDQVGFFGSVAAGVLLGVHNSMVWKD